MGNKKLGLKFTFSDRHYDGLLFLCADIMVTLFFSFLEFQFIEFCLLNGVIMDETPVGAPILVSDTGFGTRLPVRIRFYFNGELVDEISAFKWCDLKVTSETTVLPDIYMSSRTRGTATMRTESNFNIRFE